MNNDNTIFIGQIGHNDEDENISSPEEELMGTKKKPITKEVYVKEEIKLPKSYENKILNSYEYVVVNDFGDDYHLTEEERKEKNKFYEVFKPLIKAKKTYRKLKEYIEVTRAALKCLQVIAENNGVMSSDKFIKSYFKGKIRIDGLFFPKYKGKDRKDLSSKYIAEIILSNEDPDIYLNKYKNTIQTYEELEMKIGTLLSDNEIERIFNDKYDDTTVLESYDFDDKEIENKPFAVVVNSKDMKNIIKKDSSLLKAVKEMKQKSDKINEQNSYVYNMQFDDMEYIARYDQENGYISESDIPQFTGSIMNDDDYENYIDKLNSYEDDNIKKLYRGKWKTQSEIDELEIKDLLDSNGYNVRSMYNYKCKEKSKKDISFEYEKIKKTKERLIKFQNGQKRKRTLSDINDYKISSKNKKEEKKKNKKKNKKIKEDKENIIETTEDILLNTINRPNGDFKDFEEEVTDWSWPNQ